MPLNSLFSWFITKRMHQIELFMKHPHEVQDELFQYFLEEAGGTRFGVDHDFQKIRTLEDFRKAVPVRNYEQFKKYIDLLKDGEQQVTWPTKVKWFAKSSGTTDDKSKYIPVTSEALEDCHYKGGKDMLALYYHQIPNASLFSGKSLVVGGSSAISTFNQSSLTGDLSAIIIHNLPAWVELKRTPSKEIALMNNWEEKLEAMALATMNEDVTNIAGVPSWTLILLQRICEIKGVRNIKEIWPNLELYMHGGISFLPYQKGFREICSDEMNFMETYNASEGFFGIQDNLERDDLLLMLDYGIYYEFIPMEEWGNDQPQTISLQEVELNQLYSIVITTNGGLWRYQIGDTIRFTSLHPYRIKITGRTKQFINIAGEELMVENAENALAKTCHAFQVSIQDFTVCPRPFASGGFYHHWIIEFQHEPGNIDAFSALLDEEIRKINSDYDAKRAGDINLHPLQVQKLTTGSFSRWMKKRGKMGGQNKVPRLHPDDRYFQQINDFLNEN